MNAVASDILSQKLESDQHEKLARIENPELHSFVAKYIQLCQPDRVFVCAGSPEDYEYIRQSALRDGEEEYLALPGHTVHFDAFIDHAHHDQARDRANTKILLPKGTELGPTFSTLDRDVGLAEMHQLLDGVMRGHTLYVCFFSLGPDNSPFQVLAVQLTDSAYVAHSELILYRPGYDAFIRQGRRGGFFRFVHSAGELDNNVSKNLDKRRIYIDVEDQTVYSVNTQYGGNTIGLKKLAMRLAIRKASDEGWLCEHMFIMGIHGPGGRCSYFTGAFPSKCGKTSTSMVPGESVIGDDIAYLRNIQGELRAVNVEKGIFGIIEAINEQDDPILWKALHSPAEIIFSNVLVTDQRDVYWVGSGKTLPERGHNFSGDWYPGKVDSAGRDIPPSHPNARFTLELAALENVDPQLDDPAGVPIAGIIYGGRDSYAWVPVEQSLGWVHGIVTKGAALESETTAATLGKEGVREFNPMSNLDFLSIPIGRYISDNLRLGESLRKPPLIFSVNYFLKNERGDYLNDKSDKSVWLKWMELRVHDEVGAIRTPTGLIPRYEDLVALFRAVLGKDYAHEDYVQQFSLRVPANLAKIDRMVSIYHTKVLETPPIVFEVLEQQKKRLLAAQKRHGDFISPDVFAALSDGEADG